MTEAGDQATQRLAAIQRTARATAAATRTPATSAEPAVRPLPPLLRAVSNITLGAFVVLVLTGVHLFFYYRPLAVFSGRGQLAGGTSGIGGFSELSRELHVVAGWLVAGGVVAGVVATAVIRRSRAGVLAVPVGAALLFAGAVGARIGWDDVAVDGQNQNTLAGIPSLFNESVQQIVRDGSEVTAGQLVGWFFVHLVLACIGFGAAAFAASRTNPK